MERLILCSRTKNGRIVVHKNNLHNISIIKNYEPNLPAAVTSFIGENGCGKTTFSNIYMQNLRHGSSNRWLERIDLVSTSISKVENLQGFPARGICKAVEESEISLWPEAFCIKKCGKSIMLLVLHVQYSESDLRSEGRDSLEFLLCLLCSRIVEIHWQTVEFRFLEIFKDFKNDSRFQDQEDILCSSVIYLLRKNVKRKSASSLNTIGCTAVKQLCSLVSCKETKKTLVEVESVGIVFVPDSKEEFQEEYLRLSKSTYDDIYASINLLADDEYIFPKTFPDKSTKLLGGNFATMIQTCVEIINSINGFSDYSSHSAEAAELFMNVTDHPELCHLSNDVVLAKEQMSDCPTLFETVEVNDNENSTHNSTQAIPSQPVLINKDVPLKEKQQLKRIENITSGKPASNFDEKLSAQQLTRENQENVPPTVFRPEEGSFELKIPIQSEVKDPPEHLELKTTLSPPPPPPMPFSMEVKEPNADPSLLLKQLQNFCLDNLKKVNKDESHNIPLTNSGTTLKNSSPLLSTNALSNKSPTHSTPVQDLLMQQIKFFCLDNLRKVNKDDSHNLVSEKLSITEASTPVLNLSPPKTPIPTTNKKVVKSSPVQALVMQQIKGFCRGGLKKVVINEIKDDISKRTHSDSSSFELAHVLQKRFEAFSGQNNGEDDENSDLEDEGRLQNWDGL